MTAPDFDPGFGRQLEALFQWRRDVRHFSTRAMPGYDMRALLETAALAPFVGNAQPSRFVRIVSADLRERPAARVDTASAAAVRLVPNQTTRTRHQALKLNVIREAPELLAVFSDEDTSAGHGLGRNTMPEMLRYPTVMAIHTLWPAALARSSYALSPRSDCGFSSHDCLPFPPPRRSTSFRD